jgi:hypothetical protein
MDPSGFDGRVIQVAVTKALGFAQSESMGTLFPSRG